VKTARRPRLRLDNHLDGGGSTLADDVLAGLTSPAKELPPKHLYDPRGQELYELICALPEYYPTRSERLILEGQGARLAALTGAEELLELGAGSARKTVLLADALCAGGTLRRYLPVDISPSYVEEAARRLGDRHPSLELHGVVADLERHLDRLPAAAGRRLVAFLGSTIGNLKPPQRLRFLRAAGALAGEEGVLLIGYDLLKDRRTLLAAYDDSRGVTAAFNLNLLAVVNRELEADFNLDRFCHVARFDESNGWVEMRLRSLRDQTVRIPPLGLEVRFEAGEELRTEVSAKFSRAQVIGELAASGLGLKAWLTDPRRRFALAVAAPA